CKLQIVNCKLQIEEESPCVSSMACRGQRRPFFNLQFAIYNLQFTILSFSLLFFLPAGIVAQPAEEKFEPPVSGKPEEFTGAVGIFRISATLSATTAQVGQPVLFTLRVT